jgi:hypothetical protein
MQRYEIAVVSDIHYACEAEQARRAHELKAIKSLAMRLAISLYRDHIWLRDPYGKNHLLEQFLAGAGMPDLVVANGDYSLDTHFVGVADDAACESARQCLSILRGRFGEKFVAGLGDHELGKFSLVGNQGGLRITSWRRATVDLGLKPCWEKSVGKYVLLGITSTMVALPVFEPEILPEEREEWQRLRDAHLQEVRNLFAAVKPDQKIILFCHDPTALPFLWRDEIVRPKVPQIEKTIIGHLHSPLILWKSRVLAGMPAIRFLGNSIRRYSSALREAKYWRPFNVCLCPSVAGLELLKDGGFLRLRLDAQGIEPLHIERQRIHR